MQLAPIDGLPRLQTSPNPSVRLEGTEVVVELDDVDGQRLRLGFRPYQALRVTTEDCFVVPEGANLRERRVFEVHDSPWLLELRQALARSNETATFMDRAHHFLMLAGDRFIEVVAWQVTSAAAS